MAHMVASSLSASANRARWEREQRARHTHECGSRLCPRCRGEVGTDSSQNDPNELPAQCLKSKLAIVVTVGCMLVASAFISACYNSNCYYHDRVNRAKDKADKHKTGTEYNDLLMFGFSNILLTAILVNKKYGEETAQRITAIFLTCLLLASSILSLLSEEGSLLSTSSAVFSAFLFFPYAGMCSARKEKKHVLILLVFVLPSTVLSSITEFLPTKLNIPTHPNFRIGLLVPAISFICYEISVVACSGKSLYNRALAKTLLRGSSGAMLVGASITGTALALDLHNFTIVIVGATLAFAGGLAFNACLIVQRLKGPKPSISGADSPEIDVKAKSFGLLAVICLICGVLLGIYFCLSHYRIAVILPIILLVCLYFALVFLHDSHTALTVNCLNFFTTFISFVAVVVIQWLNIPAGTRAYIIFHYNPSAPVSYDEVHEELKIRSVAMWIAAVECSLMFIYFMMTTLVQAEKASEGEDNEASSTQEDRELLPIAATVPTAKPAPQPAVVLVSAPSSTYCSSSTSRCTENNRWSAPTHVTLNLPD